MREESRENQHGAEKTNRENRRIASLTVWPSCGAQFSTFWHDNSLQDDGNEAKLVFGCIYLSKISQKEVFAKKEKKSPSSPSSLKAQVGLGYKWTHRPMVAKYDRGRCSRMVLEEKFLHV